MPPLLIFCDRDPELQTLAHTIQGIDKIVDGYYTDVVDIIHTASNPFFSMGGGWDGYLHNTFDVQFTDELQEYKNVVSIISVDENCNTNPALILAAYTKYLRYCHDMQKKRIGLVGLGCGTGALSKQDTMTMLQKAITTVFPEKI